MLERLFRRKQMAESAPKDQPKTGMDINAMLLASIVAQENAKKQIVREVKPYQPAPGVVPKDKMDAAMALDATPYQYINNMGVDAGFMGYPYLAQLSQLPEYRKMTGTLAKEMTRKWIKLVSVGDDDKSDKIQKLNEALVKYRVRQAFKKMADLDGYFGRGQIYIDLTMPGGKQKVQDNPDELSKPLFLDKRKITKGSLLGIRCVEPMWTYPGMYNADNPLASDYYTPSVWYVMGKTVHASRMLTFISRPLPDMLKAAYNFGGLSLSQLAEPYVNNWLRTRDSVSDMVHAFSLSGLKTNMTTILSGVNDPSFAARAQLFNALRDSRGLMLVDKDTEEFFQFNTPLTGLDALQAQSQEQMSSVSSIPLVKLLGITPSGLNATSDGEIRVFYDDIASDQESQYRDNLKTVIDIIQLSDFGEVDPEIGFQFEPLFQLSELEKATKRKTDSDTDVAYVGAAIVSAEEVRERLADDPESPYHSMDLSDDPPEPDEEGEENDPADDEPAPGSKS